MINGDQVSLNPLGYTATFNNPNAGSGKPVTVSGLSLLGSAATNYVLTQPTGLTATIAPAPLTLQANNLTMNNGEPVPTLTFTAVGLVGSDTTTSAFTTPANLDNHGDVGQSRGRVSDQYHVAASRLTIRSPSTYRAR